MSALYVAGPMSGLPDFNYPAFFKAQRELEDVGYIVLNPARAEGRQGCKTWLDFMRASLLDIAECDGIAALDGWGSSRGAALECHIVRSLDLPVRAVAEWIKDGAA